MFEIAMFTILDIGSFALLVSSVVGLETCRLKNYKVDVGSSGMLRYP